MTTTRRSLHPMLIVGAGGQLGRACATLLGDNAVALTRERLDICDRSALRAAVEHYHPSSILNCAAATDVDRCELDHAYADSANWSGPQYLAALAAECHMSLVHVSTDFVFDGMKSTAYAETDTPHPVNYYGLSKLRGEEAVLSACADALVVRTSWLFGRGGATFPQKVLQWAAGGGPLRVATDQRGSPTFASDLAAGVLLLLERGATGLYHLAGNGCASRYELAEEVLRVAGLSVTVHPALASDFPTAARRPTQSCLDCSKAASLGVILSSWREGVDRFLRSDDTIRAGTWIGRFPHSENDPERGAGWEPNR